MTVPATDSRPSPDSVFRAPLPEEMPRVVYLFRHTRLHDGSRFLVAERLHPIARFIAAVSWWADGEVGRFQLTCQPGVPTDSLTRLVGVLVQATREAGLEALHYADLLPDGHGWLDLLKTQGFERVRSERCFETAFSQAWMRVNRLYQKHQAAIPAGWRTDAIREHRPEVILGLIAPHRLVAPDEVRHRWYASAATGFDPELSCILFDRERPFGAFLIRRPADVVYVDVQVVQEPNRRLRSLGDIFLVYHVVRRTQPAEPIRWVRFRSGETEHRQTANLALRMGGRELGQMHIFGKVLNP